MTEKIKTVHEYIQYINNKNKKMSQIKSCKLFAYRGEEKSYITAGQPNLFRGETYEKLIEFPSYEKNIVDEVMMNKLSTHDNYLLAAMDAQHGGFPSRLLDISFNSLVALFFAVTPHFRQSIDSSDNEDGIVIIYAIDKMYSANSSEIQAFYYDLLKPNSEKRQRIYGYCHKFIDYSNINNRIRSQQGGFILFSGNQFVPIPEWKTEVVIIDAKHKKDIRNDLKMLFGLTMGSVYPESDNLVGYLVEKAEVLVENNDSLISEVEYEIDMNLQYFLFTLKKMIYSGGDKKEILKKVQMIETYLVTFMESYNDFSEDDQEKKEKRENIDNKIKKVIYEVLEVLPDDIKIMTFAQLEKAIRS